MSLNFCLVCSINIQFPGLVHFLLGVHQGLRRPRQRSALPKSLGGPEVHEATGTLHNGLRRPRQRSALPKSLPSSGRIWTCGGGSRERSSKSKPKRLHPGAKVWIQEVLLCQQWSAEDVIVGSINERSADGSRNQDHKTNKRWSAEEAVIVSGNILVPRSGSKKSTDGSRDQ